MDIFILLATMLVCFLIGMPIAYSLALAAIAGAWSIGIPLEAVMLKISDGVSKVAMLTIPFFVLAGAIMAEGGMARRLVAFADVLVGFTRVRGGLSIVNVLATTFLSGISGSAVADKTKLTGKLSPPGIGDGVTSSSWIPGMLFTSACASGMICAAVRLRSPHDFKTMPLKPLSGKVS